MKNGPAKRQANTEIFSSKHNGRPTNQHHARNGSFERSPQEFEARFDAAFVKPTLVHLQHKTHRFAGAMAHFRQGRHVGQVDDGAIVGHKGRRQRAGGVFHPKALHAGLLKHKQHAFVERQIPPPHQSDAALLRGVGHLGIYLVHPSLQGEARQVALGLPFLHGLCPDR